MKLYQTPEGGPVIEHDGALWQPTGDAEDAETPNLQFHDGDLAEYGWEPYTGPRDGLTPVAERQPGRRLPRLLATPDSLSEAAWEFLRAQDDHVGLYVAQGWGDGEWVNVEIGMYTLGHTPGHTPYYEKILARHLDNCDRRRHHRRTRPALDELRVLTWEGDSREPEEHTLTPERVARLLADRRQDAEQQLREAEGRLRRHAVRLVREGAEPSEVVELFGDLVAEAVDREVRAVEAEKTVGEALAEIESPVTMRVERDRFGGDELRVTPDVLADWEAELTGQTAASREEVAEAVDRVCAAIARRGLAVRVASDPHAGEWIVVSY